VYYHFDSGTIIKVFDKTEFIEALERLKREGETVQNFVYE